MPIRYPAPLRPGDAIGVTSPSSGVPADLLPRLEVCLDHLRARGYRVVVGGCMDGTGVTSAPAAARGAELTAMLTDPGIAAVVPPWGGELAVEVVPHLDLDAIAVADPTWLVGFSDVSLPMLTITTVTGTATLHGQNLLDTPYDVPAPLAHWLDVAEAPRGSRIVQGPSIRHRRSGFDDWATDPAAAERTLDTPGSWSLLDPGAGPAHFTGRLVGGCLETVSILAGTPWGDVRAFADRCAPEGLVVHVEASGDEATDVARHLWRLRLAGWFDRANGVLVGRTGAPDSPGFSQLDAVRSALGDLDVSVVLDVDCGHLPPHLALVEGALAEVVVGEDQSLVQVLG